MKELYVKLCLPQEKHLVYYTAPNVFAWLTAFTKAHATFTRWILRTLNTSIKSFNGMEIICETRKCAFAKVRWSSHAMWGMRRGGEGDIAKRSI